MKIRNSLVVFIIQLFLILALNNNVQADDTASAMELLKESAHADKLGDEGKRLNLLRQANALDLPNGKFKVFLLLHLSAAETVAGNLVEGQKQRNLAIKIAENGNMHILRFSALTHIIGSQIALGDLDDAKKNLAAAEKLYSSVQYLPFARDVRSSLTGSMERGRAQIAQAEGLFSVAEAAYRRSFLAHEDFRVDGAKAGSVKQKDLIEGTAEREVEVGLMNLASIMLLQGRPAEAELFARQLLSQAQTRLGEKSFSAGLGHRVMSMILSERGQYAAAEREANMALVSLKSVGVVPYANSIIFSQQALATALANQDKWQDAVSVFNEIQVAVKADPVLAAKIELGNPHWALSLVQISQTKSAIDMLEKMLARQLQLKPETATEPLVTRGLLGLAQFASGQEELAEASFRRSVPGLLENLNQLNAEDQGSVASETMIHRIVDSYIDLLMRRHQAKLSVPNGEPLDLAFRFADMSAASTVSRSLAASAARSILGDTDSKLAEMVRNEQDMSQRLNQLSQTLEGLSNVPDPKLVQKNIASLRKEIEQTRSARNKLHSDILKRSPTYASLTNPRAPGLADVTKLLKPDEAFVSFHSADNKTYIWAMRSGQPVSFAIVDLSRKELDSTVDKLRKALDPGEVSIGQTPPFDVSSSHHLYRQLFGPIESTLNGAKKLIVVTPGPLGRLPLSLLVTKMPAATGTANTSKELFAEYKQVPWLVRSYAVTNLPSVVNFPALRLNNVALAKKPFAGFGDPLFSLKQTETGKKRGGSQLRALKLTRSEPESFNASKIGIIASEISFLPQLPETRDEILAMAKVLNADISKDVFLGADANEVSVRGANLIDRRVIAFSTHGLVPGELSGLDSPALALSAPELATKRDQSDNGFLTLEKVLTLKLNAEWVVLSACNTAGGQGTGAEAYSGLGRAFFFAGARSILVSQWPVESKATEKLITATLQNYATNQTLGRAEALRLAELDMIDNKYVEYGNQKISLAHPLFWSAFSLVGEGGAQK